jgi:dCMP deaminase
VRDSESQNETKYPYVVHAEANAILNSTKDLHGSRIYVALFPCNECTKLIIQSGIKEIIYLSDKYKDTDSVKASKRMLEMAGVTFRQLSPGEDTIEIDFTSIT